MTLPYKPSDATQLMGQNRVQGPCEARSATIATEAVPVGAPPPQTVVSGLASFFVPGRPATKGSARAYTYRRAAAKGGGMGARVTNDNPRAAAWDRLVTIAAKANYKGEPVSGPVAVRLVFLYERPKSHGVKFGRHARRPLPPATSRALGDVDKAARCCLDSLTGVIFYDDAQVVSLTAEKQYALPGETPGARVVVLEVQT